MRPLTDRDTGALPACPSQSRLKRRESDLIAYRGESFSLKRYTLECGGLSPLLAGDLSPSESWVVSEPLKRGSAGPTSRPSGQSGDKSPHCYELCQGRAREARFFLSKSFFSVFLSYRVRVSKRFPGAANSFPAVALPAIRARPHRVGTS